MTTSFRFLNIRLPLGFVLHVLPYDDWIPWQLYLNRQTWLTPEQLTDAVLPYFTPRLETRRFSEDR